jgi:hypothetical protein
MPESILRITGRSILAALTGVMLTAGDIPAQQLKIAVRGRMRQC